MYLLQALLGHCQVSHLSDINVRLLLETVDSSLDGKGIFSGKNIAPFGKLSGISAFNLKYAFNISQISKL